MLRTCEAARHSVNLFESQGQIETFAIPAVEAA